MEKVSDALAEAGRYVAWSRGDGGPDCDLSPKYRQVDAIDYYAFLDQNGFGHDLRRMYECSGSTRTHGRSNSCHGATGHD